MPTAAGAEAVMDAKAQDSKDTPFYTGRLRWSLPCCTVAILRGQKAVRADHRLYKTPVLSLLLSITAFSGRMLFIRPENAIGARSAQVLVFACDGI
jgi:hypothetical protein